MSGHWQLSWVAVTAMLTGVFQSGCFHNADDCTKTQTCPSTGGGGSGGSGGTGGAPPECIPAGTSSPIGDDCGVFVSADVGSDAGDGTKAKPFATLGEALASPNGKRIYVCTSPTPLDETATIEDGAVLYGGLDCATWTYVAGQQDELDGTRRPDRGGGQDRSVPACRGLRHRRTRRPGPTGGYLCSGPVVHRLGRRSGEFGGARALRRHGRQRWRRGSGRTAGGHRRRGRAGQ
jgi:hypothetical protein